MDHLTTAEAIKDDGKWWVRITPPNGLAWEELKDSGWTYLPGGMGIGYSRWVHRDGRRIRAIGEV